MSKKHVQVRLDAETYKKLQHYIVDHDTTVQEALEKAIKKMISDDENKEETARQ